nr:hypothetical protein [Nitrosomonas sp.]
GGTFFGEAKQRQEYSQYLAQCRKREQTYAPKVAAITNGLLNETKYIQSPVDAVKKLHELSQKHMVEQAVEDISIDARVFGPAAPHIEMSRRYYGVGNIEMAQTELSEAKQTAVSSSCPSMIKNGLLNNQENSEKTTAGKDQFGSLEFKCRKGHVNRRPPAKSSKDFLSHCKTCGVSVKC